MSSQTRQVVANAILSNGVGRVQSDQGFGQACMPAYGTWRRPVVQPTLRSAELEYEHKTEFLGHGSCPHAQLTGPARVAMVEDLCQCGTPQCGPRTRPGGVAHGNAMFQVCDRVIDVPEERVQPAYVQVGRTQEHAAGGLELYAQPWTKQIPEAPTGNRVDVSARERHVPRRLGCGRGQQGR